MKLYKKHAIISLTTLFEIFYKELLQELLYRFPKYFNSIETKYSAIIKKLTNDSSNHDHQSIAELLDLKNRFKFLKFFKSFKLNFLLSNEKELVEYIYIWRNCFVHNGGKVDNNTLSKLQNVTKPVDEVYLSTESKRLRTKMKRLIPKIHSRITNQIMNYEGKI